MFCSRCGRQIPDGAMFCNYCGTSTNAGNPDGGRNNGGKKGILIILGIIVVLLIGVIIALLLMGDDTEEVQTGHATTEQTQETEIETEETTLPETTSPPAPVETLPPDGWYEEDGNTYYYEDGQYYVGTWEIGGHYYFFDDDGVLLRNTTAEDEDGYKYSMDRNGRITAICYPHIYGQWASTPYSYGSGGRSSVMEYTNPIENVASVDFYIEVEGNYNANLDGLWYVLFKIDGEWMTATSFNYSGDSTTTHIQFPSSVTIEAVTAYPTKQGNASYSCYYELQSVWCGI